MFDCVYLTSGSRVSLPISIALFIRRRLLFGQTRCRWPYYPLIPQSSAETEYPRGRSLNALALRAAPHWLGRAIENSLTGASQSGEGQPGAGQSGEGQSGASQSGEGQSGEGQSGEGQSGAGLIGKKTGRRKYSRREPSCLSPAMRPRRPF
jgi:uncharacterized low-complexity protein